jgi:hypothetical protein
VRGGHAQPGGLQELGLTQITDFIFSLSILCAPQLCVERDLIRDYFQQHNSAGFEYAYTFPGMNRVLQAIGRVIRSETDHGVVLLIDARINEVRYRRLFPAWWKYMRVRHSDGLQQAVDHFWEPFSI